MNKTINKIIYAIFSVLLVLTSCKVNRSIVLPDANIDKNSSRTDSINTERDEVAPYRLITSNECELTVMKEYTSAKNLGVFSGIRPSYMFFEDMNGNGALNEAVEYFTNNVESVSFLNSTEGLVSLSHPPMVEYAKLLNFDISDSKGGTDIFYFKKDNGKLSFKELDGDINSKFWDSHPFIGNDSNCNVLLVWSSDRKAPYSKVVNVEGKTILRGHTDLYYCFGKFEEGEIIWSDVKSLGADINTEGYNEVSPYIVCLSKSPKLLFASNRGGNYDIYRVPISVDFINQEIFVQGATEALNNPEDNLINTSADEMFPFVANNREGKLNLFVSSNRNNIGKIIGNAELKAKGGYDIYQFDYTDACEAPLKIYPTVKLNVVLRDVVTQKEVVDPVINIINSTASKSDVHNKSSVRNYQLEPGLKYFVSAYSTRMLGNCEVKDSTDAKQYYVRNIQKREDIINWHNEVIEYDTILASTHYMRLDTTYHDEYCPMQDIDKRYKLLKNESVGDAESKVSFSEAIVEVKPVQPIAKDSLKKIGVIKAKDNRVYSHIKIRSITKNEWLEDVKKEHRIRNIVVYDTIPQYDTTMVKANTEEGIELLTRFINLGDISSIEKDTVINLVFDLYPEFFKKVPCKYEFNKFEREDKGSVPFFQTAYWKVNTKRGLDEYLNSLKEGYKLNNIRFIELHPLNYLYRAYSSKKMNRDERKKQYREYAKNVDANLREMTDKITKVYIPALDSIDQVNKIYVKIEAWSDKRDAGKCWYRGDEIVYMQGTEDNERIEITDIRINDGASLDTNNANLSKLRVYYGWKEIEALLEKDAKYREFKNNGLVFYPTITFDNDEERQEALDNARIIILLEGRQADPTGMENILDYDPIRRITMTIKLIKYQNKRVIPSECCKEEVKSQRKN